MDERNEQQLDEQEVIVNESLIGQLTFDEVIAELRLGKQGPHLPQ